MKLSKSRRLARMHQTLLTETRMCVHALEDKYSMSDTRVVVEHQEIVAAIEGGDADLVDRLIIAHMADAVGRLAPRFPALESRPKAPTC